MTKNIYTWIEIIGRNGSLFFFGVISISHVYYSLFPTYFFLDERMLMEDHKVLYLIIALLLAIMGSLSQQLQGVYRKKVVPLVSKVGFAYLLIAIFITFSFRIILKVEGLLSNVMFLIGVVSFFQLVTYIIPLYSTGAKKQQSSNKVVSFFQKSLFVSFALLTILISSLVVGKVLYNNIPTQVLYQKQLHENLYISSIEPSTTTHAATIIIKGYNFGWRIDDDKRYNILSRDGPLPQIAEWTDTKLTVTVPLHLRVGENELWVVRPFLDENGKTKKILTSNRKHITVLSRFDFYPAASDNKIERGFKKGKRLILSYLLAITDYYIRL